MMQLDLGNMLEPVVSAARAAGKAILEIYATDFDVRLKGDSSPVTEADERADRIILAVLRELTPDIPVISEENESEFASLEESGRFWLVDPLDGTREFLNRNGEFTVNIALISDTRAVMGVVHVPVTGVTYAARGLGTATRQNGEEPPRPISARAAPDHGAIIVHSRSHADETQIAAYAAGLPGSICRVSGSSIKFCLIAAGEADFYPRFGPTMEWDTAAGHAVLKAAGGEVYTLDGQPLSYRKSQFRNPHFIAKGCALARAPG